MKLLLSIFLACTSCAFIFGQQIEAHRIHSKIVMDGQLSDPNWAAVSASQEPFFTIRPVPGVVSRQKTEVKLLYDDVAFYVGVTCYDHMDSVSKVYSVRDDVNPNLDLFAMALDTYNDHQNGFYFAVTSQGVQLDGKIIQGDFNDQLNLVWDSKIRKTDSSWVVEMRIPFSAIRFPKKDIQTWNVNFTRQISRFREESSWVMVNPDFENYLVNSGKIVGVENILPPLRLSFIPYLSAYASKSPQSNLLRSVFGGMDIKYGVNEAFTLDVTLVPDFGQVVFDNQVLNLSPFEIQFNENRQFFTEGMETFNKSGIFYSRRIGIQAPFEVLKKNLQENEIIYNAPGNAQLYNASKFSGRNKNGLGIGVFNAVSAQQSAQAYNVVTEEIREFVAAPLTNYNVMVLDQNLKNNSSVTLTNTNVIRQGSFYDANVTAFNSNLNSKDNNYFLNTSASLSNKIFTDSTGTGYNFGIGGGKQRGNLAYNVGYFEESDTYDPNDMGYNSVNNRRTASAFLAYRYFKPKWIFNKWNTSISMRYNRLYQPNTYTSSDVEWKAFAVTKWFMAFGLSAYSALTPSYDYFEPRTWGYYYIFPQWKGGGGWFSSNYQKKIALDVNAYYNSMQASSQWNSWNYSIGLRLRLSQKMLLIYNWSVDKQNNDIGYAFLFGNPVDQIDGILFGRRNRVDYTNTLDFNYTLTNRMNISCRTRHYQSNLVYNQFYTLNDLGGVDPVSTLGLNVDGESAFNLNYNAFTVDFVYRWVFLPGSELSLVWKNSVFVSSKQVEDSYLQSFLNSFSTGPQNSFSFKILYWLDAQSFKALKRKKSKL